MMNFFKTALGAVGLSGGLLPTGWLIAGAVLAILAILGGTWTAGYNYRGTLDESATLRLENERLAAATEEANRQMDSVNRIQQADTDRAATLELRNKRLEDVKSIDIQCDPPKPVPSGVHVGPGVKGVRGAVPKHPASPIGRGTVRVGPNVAPGDVDGGGSEPPLELRPGGAR